jgi:large subunit ribosomal protein L25
MKRLRQTGQVPAVLYGHGEDTVMLSVAAKDLNKVIDHGSHIVELAGSVNESALIKTIQWDAFGSSVLHLDLTRVDANEEVEVTLPIELKGEAPGTHKGGVVKFLKHELSIFCPANKLPDPITLSINELEMNQMITAGDITLPEGARLAPASAPEEPIVGCSAPTEAAEVETDAAEGAEPEVIGAKDKEEEG